MSALANPLPELAERILVAYQEAQNAARDAVHRAGIAVRKAVDCGRLLVQARDAFRERGGFVAFLEQQWPESVATAYRWIKLAESPEELWRDATSLRQAYIAVGLLPEPEPGGSSEESQKPAWNYLVHLARAERALQRQLKEVATLSRKERDLLKERIKPWVEIYQRL